MSLPFLAHRRRGATASARPAGVALGLAMLAACGSGAMDPAPYVAPAPGTVYDYGTFSNTVTAADGWRTQFVDDGGRGGSRLALFITEDPSAPVDVPPVALETLWPLKLRNQVRMQARVGEEVYHWEFRVLDTATVTVEAGTFRTYVVEGMHVPELVRDPQAASTTLHTWWYAPEAEAVVRFESSYLGGPATGRRVGGELRAIRTAAVGASTEPAAAR